MDGYRRYTKGESRTLVDVNEIFSSSGQTGIYCVPIGAMYVAKRLLANRGLWVSSYAVTRDDSGYTVPDSSQFGQIRDLIAQFLESEEMSCDLLEGLQGIEDAIRDLRLSVTTTVNVGAGGAGLTEAPQIGYTDDGVTVPPGFVDYGTYNTYKCKAIHYALDLLVIDLKGIKDLDVTQFTAVLLAGVLVTPVPFDDIAALLVILIEAALEATLDAALDELIDALENDRDEVVCFLLASIDEGSFLGELGDWIAGKVSILAESIFGFFLNNDLAQWVFGKISTIVSSLPENTCGDCFVWNLYVYQYETSAMETIERTSTTITVQSGNLDWVGDPAQPRAYLSVQRTSSNAVRIDLIDGAYSDAEMYVDGVNVVTWPDNANRIITEEFTGSNFHINMYDGDVATFRFRDV